MKFTDGSMIYSLRKTDLIPGEIYVTHYEGQGEYIFREADIHESKNKSCITVRSNYFNKSYNNICYSNGFIEYRKATYDEVQ